MVPVRMPIGHADGPLAVGRPHRAGQPVGRVVGQGHRVVVAVVGDDHEHRSEDLLLGHPGLVVHPDDQGGLDEEAGVEALGPAAAGHEGAALLGGQRM